MSYENHTLDFAKPVRLTGDRQREYAKRLIDAAPQELTADRLREELLYNPDTGSFVWRTKRRGRAQGSAAGSRHCQGYRQIRLDQTDYLAHRLVWLYVYGSWPSDHIDHINGDRDDNRLCNLRAATIPENNQNSKKRSDNVSGLTGVGFHKGAGKFRARIMAGRKEVHLGLYETAEAAREAYLAAKRELHSFQPVPRGDKR